MTDSEFNTHSELDDFFGPRKWDLVEDSAKPLGLVVGGSLSKGTVSCTACQGLGEAFTYAIRSSAAASFEDIGGRA